MRQTFLAALLSLLCLGTVAQVPTVNCDTAIPCNSANGPLNTGKGDPLPVAGGKINVIGSQVGALANSAASRSALQALIAQVQAARNTNPIDAIPLLAPSAWAATTVYKQGMSVINVGHTYTALVGGTSAGSGGPTVTTTGAITDGGVTWYYMGLAFSSSTNAPAYTPANTASGGVGSAGTMWTNTASTRTDGAGQIRDTSNFQLTGAIFTETGSSNALLTPNTGQTPVISFITDAPNFAIVANGGSAWNSQIYVDGVPLTLGYGSATPVSGSTYFHQLVFTTRQPRLIRYEMLNQQNFYGVLTSDTISKVWSPGLTNSNRGAVVGTSFVGGSNQHPVTNSLGLGEQIAKLLNFQDYFIDGLGGGTGYIAAGSNGTFLTRLPNVVTYNPNVLIVTGGGINDRGAGATLATETAAIQTYLQAVRTALPNCIIFVVGSEAGATGPAANVFTMEAAASAAVNLFNDPAGLTFYVPQSFTTAGKAMESGTGTTAAPNGSGNSDLYTGADTIHPVQAGVYYLAKREANGILQALNSVFYLNGGGAVSHIPAPALAAGYTTPTFGPNAITGTNWFDFNFYGNHPATGQSSQNQDGTLLINGTGTGSVATATQDNSKPNKWRGTVFGGGAYFEATVKFPPSAAPGTPWPAFWSNDIEQMAANAVNPTTQWQGQASNYGNWIEPDFFELDLSNASNFGIGMHNWYGIVGSATQVVTNLGTQTIPTGQTFATYHKLGFLWIPATVTKQGSAKYYLDGNQVGATVFWNQYNPALPPPPDVWNAGGSAFSVLDTRHLALILNASTICPMTILSVSVWQASAANNITQ